MTVQTTSAELVEIPAKKAVASARKGAGIGSDPLRLIRFTRPGKKRSRAYITLNSDEPGVRGLFRFRPETALPLNALVDVLLRGESTLTQGERELIATYVSARNECRFCCYTHAALAAVRLPEGMPLVQAVCADPESAPVPAKLKALLRLAGAVQEGGRHVTEEHVTAARAEGATDLEIHDTVLIAAAFCMFNRYVDGLGTHAPDDPAAYAARARMKGGYVTVLAEALRQAQA
ncbi:carboxymuconolactone decarboxylase family protein [Streptosporangium pseudovulgare]|uniref:carboxymuconolactone decarboxylase family protein n=1 Tax=Streptosporangium pseudovulgare TaxID=35765 RepID=UPI001E648BCF|nr:carboxymuconolactone decarboxylase family protein [Streptosporangium pseudovulgare]